MSLSHDFFTWCRAFLIIFSLLCSWSRALKYFSSCLSQNNKKCSYTFIKIIIFFLNFPLFQARTSLSRYPHIVKFKSTSWNSFSLDMTKKNAKIGISHSIPKLRNGRKNFLVFPESNLWPEIVNIFVPLSKWIKNWKYFLVVMDTILFCWTLKLIDGRKVSTK